MSTYVALIRGINVGGNQMLPMKDLVKLMEKNACTDVRTYIQSGNVVFCSTSDAASVAKRLSSAIEKGHGFEPRVLVLTAAELAKAAAANPFPEAEQDPKTVHLFFLAARPTKADLKGMDALKTRTERYALKGTVFYLHTPDGFGTSKLAARVEKLLGVEATARNWRTVGKLLELAKPASKA
jgi:uncharacterized protein (DUF1697 family)